MLRTLMLILVPLALLAAACSGGSTQPDVSEQPATDGADPSIVIEDEVDDGQPDSSQERSTDDDAASILADDGGSSLFESFNPFDLLGAAGGISTSFGEIDPTLEAALIRQDDLPDDYVSVGEFTFTVPGDVGEIELAGRMFSTGDTESENFADMGSMVMSSVMALPPGAVDELADIRNMEAEFEQLQAEVGEMGFGELELLDASDLGDGGVGMHMTLDFSGLLGAFVSQDEADSLDAGISMDMYLIPRGERVLMLMVMWPSSESSGVDGRSLAETMDERAASAF